MRLVVTGATGFVGRHLIEHLAGRHELYAVSRRRPEQAPEDCTWIEQDLRAFDPGELARRVDGIVHFDGRPATATSPTERPTCSR